jgi:hypothetical protein
LSGGAELQGRNDVGLVLDLQGQVLAVLVVSYSILAVRFFVFTTGVSHKPQQLDVRISNAQRLA